jgi:hypothetical protein
MPCQKIVLKGVGAATMNPNAMGKLTGRKELTLHAQGMYSPVSGWIAVLTTVSAVLILEISAWDRRTYLVPVI